MRWSSKKRTHYPAYVREVAEALESKYRNFAHYNLEDPFEELLFIVLSTKTTEPSYRASFQALKNAFPKRDDLIGIPAERITSVITKGGLSFKKGEVIRNLVNEISNRFSSLTLDSLKKMSENEAEEFLSSLPGIGKKTARCVMMYSLKAKVFPVDIHCWRISRRLGWIRPTQKDKHCSPRDMDRLQEKIPPDLRFSLHVNMVSLGREICLASAPKCVSCPVLEWCPMIGVSKKAK